MILFALIFVYPLATLLSFFHILVISWQTTVNCSEFPIKTSNSSLLKFAISAWLIFIVSNYQFTLKTRITIYNRLQTNRQVISLYTLNLLICNTKHKTFIIISLNLINPPPLDNKNIYI